MTAMKRYLLAWMCLQLPMLAHAGQPTPTSAAAPLSEAERYARRCQSQSPHRTVKPQGTMPWGTRRDWNTEKATDERTSVLVSADLAPLKQADAQVKALTLEGGLLVAAGKGGVVGTVLQGTALDLGKGDLRTLRRTDVNPASALLRNQSYEASKGTSSQGEDP